MSTVIRKRWMPLVGLLFAVASTGCAAERLAAPKTPPLVPEPADLTQVKLALRTFDATNQSPADVEAGTRTKLQQAFLSYLTSSASYGLVVGPSVAPPKDALELDVFVRVEHDADRTIVFDGLFFYPFCGTFPFTPEWGHATVDTSIRFRDPAERPIEVRVVAPYSIIFYSWYRTGPIEDAFRRAHDAAFRQLTEQLASRLAARERRRELARRAAADEAAALALAAESSTTASVAAHALEAPPTITRTSARFEREPLSLGSALLPGPSGTGVDRTKLALDGRGAREVVRLPPEGVNIVAEPFERPREEPGFVSRWLGALGGLEGSLTGGVASVESRARTASSWREELLGSGKARSHGYRVALYQPPDRTGFFFPPSLGFLSQSIDIEGFEHDVPLAELAGSETIGVRATDPTTGAPVNLRDVIPYSLRLQSGYVGQGIGLNMVIGTEDVQLFGTLRGALNLAEVRNVRVDFNGQRADKTAFAAFQSGSLGAQVGLAVPPLHLAVRAAVEVAWYAQFDYPLLTNADGRQQKPEFDAPTRYNPEKNVYESERVFVEGVGLRTIDWVVSTVLLF